MNQSFSGAQKAVNVVSDGLTDVMDTGLASVSTSNVIQDWFYTLMPYMCNIRKSMMSIHNITCHVLCI